MARAPLVEFKLTESAVRKFTGSHRGVSSILQRRVTPAMVASINAMLRDAVSEAYLMSGIQHRSGAFREQLFDSIKVTPGRLGGLTAGVYAPEWIAIHETGGTIRPKRTQYLTLPMPAALFPDGRKKKAKATDWRSYGTFVLEARSGKKFIVYRDKETRRLVFLYYLAEEVNIRQTLNVQGSVQAMLPELMAEWGNAIYGAMATTDLFTVPSSGGSRATRGSRVTNWFRMIVGKLR